MAILWWMRPDGAEEGSASNHSPWHWAWLSSRAQLTSNIIVLNVVLRIERVGIDLICMVARVALAPRRY